MRLTPLICALLYPSAFAATPELPSCEARPEVNKKLTIDLGWRDLDKLKWNDRLTLEDSVITALTAQYPREIEPHLYQIRNIKWANPSRFPQILATYRNMAADHPGDPLALALGAVALFETDTPKSLRLAEAARAKAPQFPYPALFLARAYSEGERADKTKFVENLRAYFAMCPASTDSTAHSLLSKLGDNALQATSAKSLRTTLAKETDRTRLEHYTTLWALEFRTTPPSSHDALRKQVASDLKRIESLEPKLEVRKLEVQDTRLLMSGYKQSGASKETITAFEDRILKELPNSDEAFGILNERWKKANKEPESQIDRTAWLAHKAKLTKQVGEWKQQFPNITWLPGYHTDLLLENDKIKEADGVALIESQLAYNLEWQRLDAGTYSNPASTLIEKKWRPERALALLEKTRLLQTESDEALALNDNMGKDQREQRTSYAEYQRYQISLNTLQAAMLLHKPEAAAALREQIEATLPTDSKKSNESRYWRNRALLAQLDKRNADALTYFEKALRARHDEPKMRQGKLEDPLMDETKALWKELGGTETAFALWNAPPTGAAGEPKQGRWTKPTKDLPSFELSDLSGKTWRLKSLEGKTVMINLWATWCGPCKAELPEFQKLYEKLKERTDVQIISFNIDGELGLVAPFMKENGYTFPALLAHDFTIKLLDGIVIPQNWVIDSQGKWRWTQMGYGSEPDWSGEMIKRLETTKPEAPQ